jgi:hypothetical protein
MIRVASVVAGIVLAFVLPVDMPGRPGAEGTAIAGPAKKRKKKHRRPPAPAPVAPAADPAAEPAPAPAPPPVSPQTVPWPPAAAGTPAPPSLATPDGTVPAPADAARSLEAVRPAAAATSSAHGGFVADMDCSACHSPDGWSVSASAGASGFDHDRTGFPLRGAHAQRTCTACHTSDAELATTCEGCHRDPHAGRMDGACAECHQATSWTDTDALDLHRRTRMPLTGRHATVECTACHTRQSERTWTDVPTDCYACHRTDYERDDIHPLHTGDPDDAMVPPFPRDCASCHRTSSWTGAVIDPMSLPRTAIASAVARLDHDAWFVVSSGAHRGAECTSCHTDRRRMQRARCDGCHTSEAIAAQHPGRTVARASRSCLRCHPRGTSR